MIENFNNDSVHEVEINELFIKAVWILVECGRVSATPLQRGLGLGFPKALRFIDKMTELGYVSPLIETYKTYQENSRARTVILTKDEFVALYGHIDISK